MSEIRAGAMTYFFSSSGSVLTATIKGTVTDSDRESVQQCFQEIESAKEATGFLNAQYPSILQLLNTRNMSEPFYRIPVATNLQESIT